MLEQNRLFKYNKKISNIIQNGKWGTWNRCPQIIPKCTAGVEMVRN